MVVSPRTKRDAKGTLAVLEVNRFEPAVRSGERAAISLRSRTTNAWVTFEVADQISEMRLASRLGGLSTY